MNAQVARVRRQAVAGLFVLVLLLNGVLPIHAAAPEDGTTGEATAEDDFTPDIEKLLTETSDPNQYTDLQRCIPTRSIRDTQILDDRHIVFELPSKNYYLVQFKHRCMRLNPESTLIYETRGGQLCRLDQIQASNNFSMRDIGPPCSIPGFQAVTSEQVALLKESLKATRKREIEALEQQKAEAAKAREKEKEESGQ